MDWELIAKIASPVLLILSIVLGMRWRQFKALVKEASEVVVALGLVSIKVTQALEDNSISDEERHKIVEAAKQVMQEVRELVDSFKALIGK